MDVGEISGRRLYTGLWLNYRLRLWAATSASHASSAVDELLVLISKLLINVQTFNHFNLLKKYKRNAKEVCENLWILHGLNSAFIC